MSLDTETTGTIYAQAIIRLVRGEEINKVAEEAGLPVDALNAALDEFLALHGKDFLKDSVAASEVKRNEPCPCGSKKKYKKCCEQLHKGIMDLMGPDAVEAAAAENARRRWLGERLNEAFGLLAEGRVQRSLENAEELLLQAPQNDRIHDLVYNAHLIDARFDDAMARARARYAVAEEEMAHFLKEQEHRLESQDPLAHLYHPHVWLKKLFIAKRALKNSRMVPDPPDEEMRSLARKLLLANDMNRFPETGEDGIAARRKGLNKVLARLKQEQGALPYLLEFCHLFSWAAALAPDVLAAYKSPLALDALVDMAVYDYPFVGDECVSVLAQMGDGGVNAVKEAFEEEPEFDPIKTPLVRVLAKVRSTASVELLRSFLGHASVHVVNEAGLALAEHGDPRFIPELEEANKRIGEQTGLDMAIQGLKQMAEAEAKNG